MGDEVASYQSWSPLKSKGTLGGAYSYIDATVSEGEWLYRIVAEQSDNSRAIVCQVGVSVAVWKSTSELGYCGDLLASMAWNLYVFEQMQLRGRRRVDGVGCPK